MWSFDWVTISQQHQVAETIGKNLCIWVCSQTGKVISEGVGFLSHEGSHSTSVSIRSHNGFIEWSGNPSRWGRPDNLFGYTSMRDCLLLINSHLASYGLPPFTISEQSKVARFKGRTESLHQTGAVLTRVDLNQNFATGDAASARTYLRAASSAVYRGKQGNSTGLTTRWGEAKNTQITCYDKGQEIVDHTKRISQNLLGDDRELAIRAKDYRKRVADFCLSQGVIRWEVRLGRQALRQKGLRSLDDWSDARATEYAQERLDNMRVGMTTGLDRTFEAFLNAGYPERRAATLSGIVSRWYMGEPTTVGVSRATWYRYQKDVKDVLGFDLRTPPNVEVINTRVRSVELKPLQIPHWYVRAA